MSMSLSMSVNFRDGSQITPWNPEVLYRVARVDRAKHCHNRMDLSLLSIVYVCVYVCGCACVCGERFDSSFGLMTF